MATKKTSIILDEEIIDNLGKLYSGNLSDAIRLIAKETLRVMKHEVENLKIFTENEIEYLWNMVNGWLPEFTRFPAKNSVIIEFLDWLKYERFREPNDEDNAFISKLEGLSEMQIIALIRYIFWLQQEYADCIEKMKFLFMKEESDD